MNDLPPDVILEQIRALARETQPRPPATTFLEVLRRGVIDGVTQFSAVIPDDPGERKEFIKACREVIEAPAGSGGLPAMLFGFPVVVEGRRP